MTRILCLWLPNWPIQRAIRCRPELKGRGRWLLVDEAGCQRGRQRCGRVLQHGGRARRAAGNAAGRGASRWCASWAVAAYEPAADRRALVKLAEACERFSPRVALEEGDEPESLLLGYFESRTLVGQRSEAGRAGGKVFHAARLPRAAGRGGDGGSGVGGGAFRRRKAECRRRNGRSQMQIPNAPVPFASPQSSRHCPFNALRIADDTAALLRELGIETIDQLLALPREELASRFGDELLRRLDQLTGTGREVIEPHRGAARRWRRVMRWRSRRRDRAVLMHVLKQLVDQLARQLAARDQGAVLLMCALLRIAPLIEIRQSSRCGLGLLQPSANARQLLELIELHLETVKLADEVDRVELRAAVVGRLGERQGELFADRWPTDPHQLAVLVNRLSSRLGYERVLRAELRAEPGAGAGGAVEAGDWERSRVARSRRSKRQGGKEKSRDHALPVSPSPCLLVFRRVRCCFIPSRRRWKWSALRRMGRRSLCGSRSSASGS